MLSYGPNVSEGREFNLMSEMVGKLLVVLLGTLEKGKIVSDIREKCMLA